jgi:histidyl-tRNA synthetase
VASGSSFTAPKGTHDVLPPDSGRWTALVARFATVAERAGYGLVVSPMFEDLDVFRRVGEATDIVTKEMYDFLDKGGRHIALRPEGTASVVRAFVQHRPPEVPWKAWYAAPNFRYERPQAGRYRQHHQLGVEALGSADPDLDVEVIALQAELYRSLGLTQVDLLLNSMGHADADRRLHRGPGAWLADGSTEIDPADRATVATNPMRVLDSKREQTRAVTADAPRTVDSLSPEAAPTSNACRRPRPTSASTHRLEPRLVRGLDYYTHTTFEFQALALDSAQNAIGGGGRYDGLVEALGGPPRPGSGSARASNASCWPATPKACSPALGRADVFVVDVVDGTTPDASPPELRRCRPAAPIGPSTADP